MSAPTARRRGPRDRPLGYAPRGTSLGLAGWLLLPVGISAGSLTCAAPIIPNGFDLWLASLPYIFGVALLPLVLVAVGLRSHRYWFTCLFFYFGILLLGAYALSLLLAALILMGVFPVLERATHVMSIMGTIDLVILAPFAWFLLRALRLKYWQPGSLPSEWEPGDETPPAWALSPSRLRK